MEATLAWMFIIWLGGAALMLAVLLLSNFRDGGLSQIREGCMPILMGAFLWPLIVVVLLAEFVRRSPE